ncbi:MAG: multicopper oxidase family protein [Myxococcota bacterium]
MDARRAFWAAAALALMATGCGDDGVETDHPADWDAELAPPQKAEDLDPDPDVVEVELVATEAEVELRDGETTAAWTYNGTVPGPLIEAEVGDRLVVHFRNDLPEETTIHWHGVELPALMDGSHISQTPVPPGETFTYEFDLQQPALYWYHPHVRSNEQVERGLYGALLVRDPETDEQLGLPEDEVVLMLDDVLLETGGAVAAPYPTDPVERATMQLNGREGNVLLTNGREVPTAQVTAGVPIRLRLVNAANARFFRLSMTDTTMHQIGTDGGLLESPVAKPPIERIDDGGGVISDPDREAGVLLVPGQRADVVFTPRGEPGDVLTLEWHDLHRGRHDVSMDNMGWVIAHPTTGDGDQDPAPLARFEIASRGPTDEAYAPPQSLRTIDPIDTTGAEVLPVTFGHDMPDGDGNVTFFATMIEGEGGVPFDDLQPDQGLEATVGDTYIYEITNMTGGDHPFHPHGFFFQPLEVQYMDMDDPANNRTEPWPRVENRDSIAIPERPGAKGSSMTIVRLAVRFDDTGREGQVEAFGKVPTDTQSGGWLVHCHILEHSTRGMMTFLNLREP